MPPGLRFPTFRDETVWVQPLSECFACSMIKKIEVSFVVYLFIAMLPDASGVGSMVQCT